MIYTPTENEAGMRLDFLASLLREGDRIAVEGVLPTIVDFISLREISSRSDLFHDSGFHCTSVEGVLYK